MLFSRRKRFDRLSSFIGREFSRLPLTANQWTIISFMPAVISGYLLLLQNFFAAALFLLAAGFLDIVDGAVARETKTAVAGGAYMDTVADRYVEFILILPLAFVALPAMYLESYQWVLVYAFGSMMTTYTKAAAAESRIGEVKGGIMERAERLLLLAFGIFLGGFSKAYLTFFLAALSVLANITALQRIQAALRLARRKK